MEPYQVGFCPCCQCQIMVKDTKGMWNSFKPNYRQAYLKFENGTKVKTIICSECLENPDVQKLMDAILHENSQAVTGKTKELIKELGKPVCVERI